MTVDGHNFSQASQRASGQDSELLDLAHALLTVATERPDSALPEGLKMALERVCRMRQPNISAELLDRIRPILRQMS
ncbi:hypothetical protein [Pedomonas mirosovicensis]|uniref:hypothetical protein n=1 Tax=Pedomonas mirosovicensis TaxID=2908641 RepID=UPI0021698F6C|nr:hypothetical protein [Pedomonas mirosovicensis]MCH8685703.1 hypothetical protein [Pedomonas mirosovicensis]